MALSPQSIGEDFVKLYFTCVYNSPDDLFKFYQDTSEFSYAKEGESVENLANGISAIKQILSQLAYKETRPQCRITILATQKGPQDGVIVVVKGVLESNSAGPGLGPFIRTFFLAQTENGRWYIRNDILRLTAGGSEANQPKPAAQANVGAVSSPNEAQNQEKVANAAHARPLDTAGAASKPVAPSAGGQQQPAHQQHSQSHPQQQQQQQLHQQNINNQSADKQHPQNQQQQQQQKRGPQQAGQKPQQQQQQKPGQQGQQKQQPKNQAQAANNNQEKNAEPVKPSTWAAAVKSIGSAPSGPAKSSENVAQVAETKPVADGPVQEKSESTQHQQGSSPSPQAQQAGKKARPDTFPIIINNLPGQISHNDLKNAFQQFGPVYNASAKSTGVSFVDFLTQEGQQNALKAGNITVNGVTLVIEPKKFIPKRPGGGGGGGGGGNRKNFHQ